MPQWMNRPNLACRHHFMRRSCCSGVSPGAVAEGGGGAAARVANAGVKSDAIRMTRANFREMSIGHLDCEDARLVGGESWTGGGGLSIARRVPPVLPVSSLAVNGRVAARDQVIP